MLKMTWCWQWNPGYPHAYLTLQPSRKSIVLCFSNADSRDVLKEIQTSLGVLFGDGASSGFQGSGSILMMLWGPYSKPGTEPQLSVCMASVSTFFCGHQCGPLMVVEISAIFPHREMKSSRDLSNT